MQAIEIQNLTKVYKDTTAVDQLSLSVNPGELICLLGVNGAGKTTTIKMLCGLTQPTAGDALLLGKSILKEPAAVKSLIGVCPQETAVAKGLTVEENLQLLCGIHGLSRSRSRERTEELQQLLGLDSVKHKKAGKLSGGYQRRLSIAMALVSRPQILFLEIGRAHV